MVAPDLVALRHLADECIALARRMFGRELDGSTESLAIVDELCEELLAAGPLSADRFELWWKLIGAYAGEVLVGAFDGAWVEHERAGGAFAVSVWGFYVFPFATTSRRLRGDDWKSLSSLARALPAIRDQRSPGLGE